MNEVRMSTGVRREPSRPAIPGIRRGAPMPDAPPRQWQSPAELCVKLPNGDPPAVVLWGDENS